MIDGVKLTLINEMLKVRELERNHSLLIEQNCHSADKVINIWYVSNYVVANNKVRALSIGDETLG